MSSKVQDILNLQVLMRSTAQVEKILQVYKKSLPMVPESIWERVLTKERTMDLKSRMVKLYDEIFSHEEIKGLIEFYTSPIGVKILSASPALSDGAMEIGRKWGDEIITEIMRVLDE